jgi:hypothetical protein
MRNCDQQLKEVVKDEIEKLVKRLSEKEYELGIYDIPWLPYCGKDYGQAKCKIYVCGKAGGSWGLKYVSVNGWDENSNLASVKLDNGYYEAGDWYDEMLWVKREFVAQGVRPFWSGFEGGFTRGAWWREIYKVAGALLCKREIPKKWSYRKHGNRHVAEIILNSIAWSNLHKISEFRGNPRRDLLKLHKDLYTIKSEMEILRPNVVWFPTAPGYDHLLRRALSLPKGSIVDTRYQGIARVSGLEDLMDPEGSIALRTYHPQGGKFDVQSPLSFVNCIREAGVCLHPLYPS